MEELQSTEVLDREILEDARRKAQRTLREADETVASASTAWEQRTMDAIGGAKERHAQRMAASRAEIMARLPLDKSRSRLERIETLLRGAASAYLAALPRQRILALLEDELALRAGELTEAVDIGAKKSGTEKSTPEAIQVSYRGLTQGELEAILKKIFPSTPWKLHEGNLARGADFPLGGDFPAVAADTQAVRVTVSAEAVVETLLEDKRGELASALLGAGVLETPEERQHA
jgi:vacuolar-type H+-ATPase subunit E/Vma4